MKALPILDIGSGRNPFLFRYPDAVTINHPAAKNKYISSQGVINHCFPADAHIYLDARNGIGFPPGSVETVLLHYVVGEFGNSIIKASECAELFSSIYQALVPNGSLYIRSIFRPHYPEGFDVRQFCYALIAGGFSLRDIDLISARCPEADSFCKRVVIESDHLEGIPEKFLDKSSFLIAQKAVYESSYV